VKSSELLKATDAASSLIGWVCAGWRFDLTCQRHHAERVAQATPEAAAISKIAG
jgi:hypothetical protein